VSRAAVLPAGADPFLVAEWLRHFSTWASQVDKLYVTVCGQEDPALRDYIAAKVEAVGGYIDFGPMGDHGQVLGRLMSKVTEDLVMLCEDDAFVRVPDKIGESFARIERGDVDIVGSPRGSGTPEVIDLANRRFGIMTASTDEQGPLLWPCFLFAKRADLERIGNYSVWRYQAGDTLLGHEFTSEQAMDTFGYASLMLRESGARIHVEPQYRADLAKMNEWGASQWFHVGSLSSGWGMYICGPTAHQGIWAVLRGTNLEDWCKRVAFWEILAERGDDLPVRDQYRASVAELARETGMDRAIIDDWRRKFLRLVTWT
jgi:hypothetical protein